MKMLISAILFCICLAGCAHPPPQETFDLEAKIQLAEAGDYRSAHEVSDYYFRQRDHEKGMYWLKKTRDMIDALPPEHQMKQVAGALDELLKSHAEGYARMEAFYAMDNETLERFIRSAESGNFQSILSLEDYYSHHGNFEEALRWMKKERAQAEKRLADEKYKEVRKKYRRSFAARQKELEKRAKLARADSGQGE